MVFVPEFRLMTALDTDSLVRFEPTIDDSGRVEYENAHDILDRHRGAARAALDSLSERELLHKEYTTKVYVCSSCKTEGMQFITACPHCESTHSISTSFLEHEPCGYMDQTTAFETDEDSYYCPDCDTEADSDELVPTEQNHRCLDCDTPFVTPEHRLWCRSCRYICPPHDATEQTLYEYTLSDEGKQWHDVQADAREILAEVLESRGFDVDIETAIPGDETETYPVHVHARDELLDQGLVIDVHSAIDSRKLEHIAAAGRYADARPTLLTTSARVPDDTLHSADRHGVMVLLIEEDGTIQRPHPMDTDRRSEPNVMDRLTAAVDLPSWAKPQ